MNTNVKLGIFVAVVVVVFMVFTLNLSSGFLRAGWRTYYVDFQNISTLEKGAPVKQAGYTIGEVTKIAPHKKITSAGDQYVVRVEIKVKPEAAINENSSGDIISLGLMGEKYIEIPFGSGVQAPEGTVLPGRAPFDFMTEGQETAGAVKELLVTLRAYFGPPETQLAFHAIVQNVSGISRATADLIGGEEKTVQETLKNLRIASEKLLASLDNANGLVANASGLVDNANGIIVEQRPQVAHILSSASQAMDIIHGQIVVDAAAVTSDMNQISNRLVVLIDRVDQLLDRHEPQVDATMQNIHAISDSAKRTATRFEDVTDSLNRTSGEIEKTVREIREGPGIVPRLIHDEAWSAAAEGVLFGASDTIQAAGNTFRAFQGWREGVGFYYTVRGFEDDERFDDDQNHIRNDLGLRLAFNDKWVFVLGAADVGGDTGLDSQIGRRLGPLTLRAGVRESEMALGMDVHFREWATLELDGIGLTDADDERFDAHALVPVHFIDGLSLYGGVQDIGEENFANLGLSLQY